MHPRLSPPRFHLDSQDFFCILMSDLYHLVTAVKLQLDYFVKI